MEVIVASKKQAGVMSNDFNLGELPEECIASIFAFTTPIDACRLALISRACSSAAESDLLWVHFLPSDLGLIVAQSEEGEVSVEEFPTKKLLYMRLADRPLLIDGATKSFWLEKPSGSKCLMLGARSLSIARSEKPRYWRWASIPESRFPEVAQLVTIRSLEIRGKIKKATLSPNTSYAAYLVFKTTEDTYGLDVEAVGLVNDYVMWPLSLTPKVPQERPPTHPAMVRRQKIRVRRTEYPKERSDGWKEVIIGRFFTDKWEEDELEFSMLEVERRNRKGGLTVEGVEIRPMVELSCKKRMSSTCSCTAVE